MTDMKLKNSYWHHKYADKFALTFQWKRSTGSRTVIVKNCGKNNIDFCIIEFKSYWKKHWQTFIYILFHAWRTNALNWRRAVWTVNFSVCVSCTSNQFFIYFLQLPILFIMVLCHTCYTYLFKCICQFMLFGKSTSLFAFVVRTQAPPINHPGYCKMTWGWLFATFTNRQPPPHKTV